MALLLLHGSSAVVASLPGLCLTRRREEKPGRMSNVSFKEPSVLGTPRIILVSSDTDEIDGCEDHDQMYLAISSQSELIEPQEPDLNSNDAIEADDGNLLAPKCLEIRL